MKRFRVHRYFVEHDIHQKVEWALNFGDEYCCEMFTLSEGENICKKVKQEDGTFKWVPIMKEN